MYKRQPVGSAVKYQNINIAVSACYKSRPDSLPESWAYVDVVDMGEPPLPQAVSYTHLDVYKRQVYDIV